MAHSPSPTSPSYVFVPLFGVRFDESAQKLLGVVQVQVDGFDAVPHQRPESVPFLKITGLTGDNSRYAELHDRSCAHMTGHQLWSTSSYRGSSARPYGSHCRDNFISACIMEAESCSLRFRPVAISRLPSASAAPIGIPPSAAPARRLVQSRIHKLIHLVFSHSLSSQNNSISDEPLPTASSAFSLLVYRAGIDGDFQRP